MIDLHIDVAGFVAWLRQAESEMQANAKQALGQSVALALRNARATQAFKDHTGALRRSIVRGERGAFSQFIKASAKHALYVEEDTKAHEIRPKRTGTVSSRRAGGKAMPPLLKFRIAGHWISKAFVKHPGTTGTHFLERAAHAAADPFVSMLERAAAAAFR